MQRIIDIKRVLLGTPPEPVTLAEAKTHCRVDFADDDDYITALIPQCRLRIENYCFISIVPRTVTANLLVDGCVSFELPYGPTTAVTGIVSNNQDGTTTPLTANTDYQVYANGNIVINGISRSISAGGFGDWGPLTFTYTTGFTTLPEDLKLAILSELAFRYDARGDSTNRYQAQQVGVSDAALVLAEPHKSYSWL